MIMTKNNLTEILFYKYQANGNDFILIEQEYDKNLFSLCNRHISIGADGILFVKVNKNIISLRVMNADGSEAYNCGNGLRCVARWFFDNNILYSSITIKLSDTCYVAKKINNKILVTMNQCLIEKYTEFQKPNFPYLSVFRADIKNLHIIWIFNHKPDVEKYLKNIEIICKDFLLYNHSFVWIADKQLYSIVFERGVGFTKSCGSAAIASVCAWFSLNKESEIEEIEIYQPGGKIRVIAIIDKNNNSVFNVTQIGDAKKSFYGFIK
jgi:diaminopimelate epimerase